MPRFRAIARAGIKRRLAACARTTTNTAVAFVIGAASRRIADDNHAVESLMRAGPPKNCHKNAREKN